MADVLTCANVANLKSWMPRLLILLCTGAYVTHDGGIINSTVSFALKRTPIDYVPSIVNWKSNVPMAAPVCHLPLYHSAVSYLRYHDHLPENIDQPRFR
jgi:hypothetical protein